MQHSIEGAGYWERFQSMVSWNIDYLQKLEKLENPFGRPFLISLNPVLII